MPKGEKHYKTRVEREVYKAAYNQMYWGRRNIERFEAQQPEVMEQLQIYMQKSIQADRSAEDAGFTDEQVGRIHARAMFDALLRISREGGIKYTEYFVCAERAESEKKGEYDIASLQGDAPEALQEGKVFCPFQLTEFEALVNCYFEPPMDEQEALLVVMSLINQGQLGNYGKIVEVDE